MKPDQSIDDLAYSQLYERPSARSEGIIIREIPLDLLNAPAAVGNRDYSFSEAEIYTARHIRPLYNK